jgi:hypothetical protein
MSLTEMAKQVSLEQIMALVNESDFTKKFINKANKGNVDEIHKFLSDHGLNDEGILKRYGYSVYSCKPENVKETFYFLVRIGVHSIKAISYIIGRNPDTLKKNYFLLKSRGYSREKIANYPKLLTLNQSNLVLKENKLEELGISREKILKHPWMVQSHIKTLKEKYRNLKKIGISDKNIFNQISLMARSDSSINKNYQNSVGLLRQDYSDRKSGRDLICRNPRLLDFSSASVESTVQHLSSIGLDYHNAVLLSSSPRRKREKIAFMLREFFDYDSSFPDKQKKEKIHVLYSFLAINNYILTRSLVWLERNREKLNEKIHKFILTRPNQ